jgi:hypothetical protein
MSGETFSETIATLASIEVPLLRHVLSEIEGSEGPEEL